MAARTDRAALVAYARQAATRHGVNPDIFVRQIDQESGFNPDARSPVGAIGIAQFMPDTARGYGIDPTDPYQSLDAAALYMRDALHANGGDYAKALAAYNAGQGAVDKYGGVPPYAETQQYVRTILGPNPDATTKGTLQAEDTTTPAVDATPPDTSPPAASGKAASRYLTQDDFIKMETAHGTLTRGPVPIDPMIANPDPFNTDKTKLQIPNPHPQYAYMFTDGTYLVARDVLDTQGNIVAKEVTNPGTALATKAAPSPVSDLVPVYDPNEPSGPRQPGVGRVIGLRDPKTGQVITVPKAAMPATPAPDVRAWPDGSLHQWDPQTKTWPEIAPAKDKGAVPQTKTFPNGSLHYFDPATNSWPLVPGGEAQVKATDPKTLTFPDGSLRERDPQTGQWKVIAGAQPKAPQITTFPDGSLRQWNADTQQFTVVAGPDPAKVQRENLDNQSAELDIAKKQRDLLPAQQKLFSDAQQSVDYIAMQMKAGHISPADANQMMDNIWKSVDASIQGTTLFQQQQDAANRKLAYAGEGRALLNQRVQSGTTLADSILGAIGAHVRMPAGQSTLGLDPFALANQEVTTLGGGPEVYDAAKAMLLGAGAGGGPGAPGASPSAYPLTREDVLARYPELAGNQAAAPGATPQSAGPTPQTPQSQPSVTPPFSNSTTNLPSATPSGQVGAMIAGATPQSAMTATPQSGDMAAKVQAIADQLKTQLPPGVAQALLAASGPRAA